MNILINSSTPQSKRISGVLYKLLEGRILAKASPITFYGYNNQPLHPSMFVTTCTWLPLRCNKHITTTIKPKILKSHGDSHDKMPYLSENKESKLCSSTSCSTVSRMVPTYRQKGEKNNNWMHKLNKMKSQWTQKFAILKKKKDYTIATQIELDYMIKQ